MGMSRIYVIAGKESSLVGARCQALLDHLLDSRRSHDGAASVLDGSQASLSEVLDELRTMPRS